MQCSIDAHNNPLTDEVLEAAKGADAIILGAVGGPVRQFPTPNARCMLMFVHRNGEPARCDLNRAS
jgi:isocitrate/isopropylmalate dehydrogenase